MPDDAFRRAARAYFLYGVVYAIGGIYLVWHGVGIPGPVTPQKWRAYVAFWAIVSVGVTLLIPYLLAARRPWFERWILTRRDFARLVAVLMAIRAVEVLRVALRRESAAVPAPWGGEIPFRLGAAIFFVVTVAALFFVARAAWARPGEPAGA